ncbi:MAG: nicotinate-nucleotide adenylyltransferase [Rubrivivax sp.]|nr:nicotinate-nucleotide adenylyltransferase [Rubrivivax sp.]
MTTDLRAAAPARIGLLGGSFDPPHLAHLALAQTALSSLQLDEVRWLPAGQPWQKVGREMAPGLHRAAMVRLLISGEPRFHLDERELHRPGATYTVDTVREFREQQPQAEFFLILGQDQYSRLDTWRDWHALLGQVTLAVAARGGQRPLPSPALAAHPHRLEVLPLPDMPESSTALREALTRGDDVSPMVGPAVAGYIAQHHLYRGPPPT